MDEEIREGVCLRVSYLLGEAANAALDRLQFPDGFTQQELDDWQEAYHILLELKKKFQK